VRQDYNRRYGLWLAMMRPVDNYYVSNIMAMHHIPPGRFYFSWGGRLGAGGLGYVDKIVITASNSDENPVGTERACKRLNDKFKAHPEMQVRFEREIATLRGLDHPNIMTCVGENLPESNERFYVMPLYSSSLRKFIAAGTKAGNWRFFADQGALLADAMSYAHLRNVKHRDLKPDNILFNHGGPLIIADWGFGGFVHKHSVVLQELTRGGMGTSYYVSLEQWSNGAGDERADIYSLGMLLDECVTGGQRQIMVGVGLNGPATAETTVGASIFNQLLRQMTQTFPGGRPSNMAAVAAELRRALSA
jgi:serine/threonine protein kinase